MKLFLLLSQKIYRFEENCYIFSKLEILELIFLLSLFFKSPIGRRESCGRGVEFCFCYCETSWSSCWTRWSYGILSIQQCGCCCKFPIKWKSESQFSFFLSPSLPSMEFYYSLHVKQVICFSKFNTQSVSYL